MNDKVYTVQKDDLCQDTQIHTTRCLQALESGKVVYFPDNAPTVPASLRPQLEADILDGKHKNLSFDYQRQKLGGLNPRLKATEQQDFLLQFMNDFAVYASELVKQAIPFYKESLIWGRTSYRPAEIKGRSLSKRKDDTRLHVDAFPASPVNGNRILRVFSNINFDGKARNWHLGEPFADVLKRFYPQIPPYRKAMAQVMHWLKATKTLRSPYDHIMLHLHDTMKLTDSYQQTVDKTAVNFPAMSSWIVFTDQASHAALGGQYLLEQTFYLPVAAMAHPQLSPLHQIEMLAKTKQGSTVVASKINQ